MQESTKISKYGTITIPETMRKHFGLKEGSVVIAEQCENGILLKPAPDMPIEHYTQERKAEFLLTNAIDADDYAQAVEEVRAMGLDPPDFALTTP